MSHLLCIHVHLNCILTYNQLLQIEILIQVKPFTQLWKERNAYAAEIYNKINVDVHTNSREMPENNKNGSTFSSYNTVRSSMNGRVCFALIFSDKTSHLSCYIIHMYIKMRTSICRKTRNVNSSYKHKTSLSLPQTSEIQKCYYQALRLHQTQYWKH